MTVDDTGDESIRTERVDGVGRVVVDRPERHNSFDGPTIDDLLTAVEGFLDDDEIRALVITGSGPAFCTGADLAVFEGDERDAGKLHTVGSKLHRIVRRMATADTPTVAGVNGAAAGGGLAFVFAADVVVAREDAMFRYAYPGIGLSGDGGATWYLPRYMGLRRAREFALLNEPVSGQAAVDLNLATEVVPEPDFEERLAEVAATLANGPTMAYGAIKRLQNRAYERDLTGHLAAELEELGRMATTDDFARGVRAFGTDEDPNFTGE